MNKWFILLVLFASCCKVCDKIEPKINYCIEEKYLKSLSPCFAPVSIEDKKTGWGKEMLIGYYFAKEFDLYRAITSFKRANALLPEGKLEQKQQLSYNILLCYYLGKKYDEVIDTFERSSLPHVDKSFCAFHDLLVILYDSYKHTCEKDKVKKTLDLIKQSYPGTYEKLTLSTALLKADLANLKKKAKMPPPKEHLINMLSNYETNKKSVKSAQVLNAVLPGSGYLYIGQPKSALTAFLVNSLFIAAAIHFFHKENYAAAAITTSFELGWYVGGIYGAGECTKFYNEQVYHKYAQPMMNQHGLFPIFMLEYAF